MGLQLQLDIHNLGKEIDAIFRRHGVNDGFGCGDFVVTDRLVTDAAREDSRISNAIVESTWPRISRRRVVHYTKRAHAEAIIREREFRLYELFKRVSNDEMRDFFKHHGFQGALNEINGQPGYYEQLKRIFYASFTHEGLDEHEENDLWDEFSPAPNDVRLIFQVDAEDSDFRQVKYAVTQKPGIPLIKELQAAVSALGDRDVPPL